MKNTPTGASVRTRSANSSSQRSISALRFNMFVSNDSAGSGGAIGSGAGTLSTSNNHFVGNTSGAEGAAAELDALGTHVNALVAHNHGSSQSVHALWNYDQVPIDYVLFWDNVIWDTNVAVPHSVRADPDLLRWPSTDCDPADLQLSAASPGIDAGDPSLLDVDGSTSDVGAFGGPDPFRFDADLDGYDLDVDCHDGDPSIHPGATEVVGDQRDQDCDGAEVCWADADGDGRGEAVEVASADLDCRDPGEALADDDRCPGFDDGLDADDDGVPDGCDPTPQGDVGTTPIPDADDDGVPDPIDPAPTDAGTDGIPPTPTPDFGLGCAATAPAGPTVPWLAAALGYRRRRRGGRIRP